MLLEVFLTIVAAIVTGLAIWHFGARLLMNTSWYRKWMNSLSWKILSDYGFEKEDQKEA